MSKVLFVLTEQKICLCLAKDHFVEKYFKPYWSQWAGFFSFKLQLITLDDDKRFALRFP